MKPYSQDLREKVIQALEAQEETRSEIEIDEAGVTLAMTRLYGRARPGERVVDTVVQNYGSSQTLLACLSLEGGGYTVQRSLRRALELIFQINGWITFPSKLRLARSKLIPPCSKT